MDKPDRVTLALSDMPMPEKAKEIWQNVVIMKDGSHTCMNCGRQVAHPNPGLWECPCGPEGAMVWVRG